MSGYTRRAHSGVLRAWLPKPGRRVVDIGCGAGRLARSLARDGLEVVGVDPQPDLLAGAGKRTDGEGPDSDRPNFVAARGEALPLAPGSLDAAIFFNALHHVSVDWQDDAVADVGRVLGPGGTLIVVEPLAEGAMFELLRPVEDETRIRAAAYRALCRAAAQPDWKLEADEVYAAPVRHASFEALCDSLIDVDPGRTPAIRAHRDTMRAAFDAAARWDQGSYWLDQPSRLTVLRWTPRPRKA